MSETPVEPVDLDLVLLLGACSVRLDDEVLARVRAAVGDDLRYRDGYVFQHLVAGPCSVTTLAGHLGVSQQAASKQVDDLVARGLVDRAPDPSDGRARLVSLTARGRRAVAAGRRARSEIVAELAGELGEEAVERIVEGLSALSDQTRAVEHLLARRLRPEDAR